MPRPWAYFDTSVLVKRYVEEDGAGQSRALLGRHRLLSSAILPVETLAALRRRIAIVAREVETERDPLRGSGGGGAAEVAIVAA